MSRLIDADALLEKLKGTPRYFEVKHDIEEMPTAYNVEKVLERLESEVIALEDNYGDLVHCIPSEVVLNQIRNGGAK